MSAPGFLLFSNLDGVQVIRGVVFNVGRVDVAVLHITDLIQTRFPRGRGVYIVYIFKTFTWQLYADIWISESVLAEVPNNYRGYRET